MGRNSGKRGHRGTRFVPPKQVTREEYISSKHRKLPNSMDIQTDYGIITGYQGQGGVCTVKVINGDKVVTLQRVKLKHSINHRKCNQRLERGNIVLVDDGTVVLVYSKLDLIPSEVVRRLQGEDRLFGEDPVEDLFPDESDHDSDSDGFIWEGDDVKESSSYEEEDDIDAI